MSQPLIVRSSIVIDAPTARVWDALVNPAQTKKYMFGCEALSDWKPGSPLLWQAEYEGKPMVFVKGIIVKIDPGKLLAYTTIDPNSGMEDIPENYVTVTYRLSEEKGQTLFTVEQGDFAHVADGQRRYSETWNNGEGWNPVLVQIKALAEAG
ncbi:MAG TPA: SRPBCC domain-containing protein [Puia sp.]|nr:SRPBCC domain-containing protein [Puia sp.]